MLGALYCNRTATNQESSSFIFSAASEQRESAKTYEQTERTPRPSLRRRSAYEREAPTARCRGGGEVCGVAGGGGTAVACDSRLGA
jgi:hypothetical protein